MALSIKSFGDCLELVKRRKFYIVIPWVLISAIAVMVAYKLPKTYRSTATMLYQAALPKIFESTASQFADEQIKSIYQRIMTTDNVLSIINSNGLYEGMEDVFTDHEIAGFFKESAEVSLVTSTLEPKASSGMAEIAFDLSFSDEDPIKAKEITSKLAALFIEQNDKSRSQIATKATDFLIEESEKLNKDLNEIDNKIAVFKEQNNFSLPEQAQTNLAALDRTENELRDTESDIQTTKERIAFLSAELARAPEDLPSKLDDKTPQNKDDVLRSLKAEYIKLSSAYSASHPSLIRLKREIKALDSSFDGERISGGELFKELEEAKIELKTLEESYSDNHPDIAQRKVQIAKLEQQIKNDPSGFQAGLKGSSVRTRNPAYLGIEAQYRTSQSELQSLMQKRDYLKEKLDKMQHVVMLAPQVEKEYNDLARERENTIKKYNQLKEKLLDAKLFQSQEEEQQGQTLTIMEKPIVPRHPEKAIRRKVAIGGFLAGMMLGLGLAILMEFLDPRLRGYQAIVDATSLMPLIVIPYIETNEEEELKRIQQQKDKKNIIWSTIVLVILASVVTILFFSPFGHN